MASAVFEGTSLVNMFVRDCWVNGVRKIIVNRREEEFFEIRTEWSDRNVLYLHRSYPQLVRVFRRLTNAFPEDQGALSRSLLQGLVAVKEAPDIETRLNEIEKVLKIIINLPCKYSRSEVVLTFFERSSIDQVLKNDNVQKVQMTFQSPVKVSELVCAVQNKTPSSPGLFGHQKRKPGRVSHEKPSRAPFHFEDPRK
ncbi:PX domain-containing protein 1 isoform X2 [Hemitrygon akajei]|uniref:PX domain-containing protein 1 isoform X2 n=1 Tax=Hemitrygon akajei TaxID=2704970 RepID=UPI003BF9B977